MYNNNSDNAKNENKHVQVERVIITTQNVFIQLQFVPMFRCECEVIRTDSIHNQNQQTA